MLAVMRIKCGYARIYVPFEMVDYAGKRKLSSWFYYFGCPLGWFLFDPIPSFSFFVFGWKE